MPHLDVSLPVFERQLKEYMEGSCDKSFEMGLVPKASKEVKAGGSGGGMMGTSASAMTTASPAKKDPALHVSTAHHLLRRTRHSV
jgi:hypothetical protein